MRRFSDLDTPTPEPVAQTGSPLSAGRKGFAGTIVAVNAAEASGGLAPAEIERRLLEMGFVEGAPVAIVQEGLFGHDPIAVRIDDRTVALRRREARLVMVRPAADVAP